MWRLIRLGLLAVKAGFVESQGSEEISAIKAQIQQLPDVDTEKIKHVQQSMGSYYSDGTEQYQNKYSNPI